MEEIKEETGKDSIIIEQRKIHFEHFKLHFELFQKYLDLSLKFSAFYILMTGAIISYYFANPKLPFSQFSLIFPVLIGAAFIAYYRLGIRQSNASIISIKNIAEKIGITDYPDYKVLKGLLTITMGLYGIIILGLLVLFIASFFPPTTL